MQVLIWIVIILLVIFIVWLLRKWIKRLIFIAILLALAFFIYGLFSPSGASKLRYNVRTFPQRVISRFSEQSFLDYDSYKLNISSEGNQDIQDDSENKSDLDITKGDSDILDEKNDKEKSEEKKEEESEVKTVQSFSGLTPQFVSLEPKQDTSSSNDAPLAGYSQTDVIGIINKYIEKNLDDDTDILVTVEYEGDVSNAERIILQTQPKSEDNQHFVSISRVLTRQFLKSLRTAKKQQPFQNTGGNAELIPDETTEKQQELEVVTPVVVNDGKSISDVVTGSKKMENGLTQSEIREAEEIFSILF